MILPRWAPLALLASGLVLVVAGLSRRPVRALSEGMNAATNAKKKRCKENREEHASKACRRSKESAPTPGRRREAFRLGI